MRRSTRLTRQRDKEYKSLEGYCSVSITKHIHLILEGLLNPLHPLIDRVSEVCQGAGHPHWHQNSDSFSPRQCMLHYSRINSWHRREEALPSSGFYLLALSLLLNKSSIWQCLQLSLSLLRSWFTPWDGIICSFCFHWVPVHLISWAWGRRWVSSMWVTELAVLLTRYLVMGESSSFFFLLFFSSLKWGWDNSSHRAVIIIKWVLYGK